MVEHQEFYKICFNIRNWFVNEIICVIDKVSNFNGHTNTSVTSSRCVNYLYSVLKEMCDSGFIEEDVFKKSQEFYNINEGIRKWFIKKTKEELDAFYQNGDKLKKFKYSKGVYICLEKQHYIYHNRYWNITNNVENLNCYDLYFILNNIYDHRFVEVWF